MGNSDRFSALLARFLSGLILAMSLVTATFAQESGRQQAILVLDASGSMWGQIDGVSKIEIAREQIGDMLGSWDDGTDLGLMAYGHREKGSCADIELVIPPQKMDPAAYQPAVNSIQPKGKTPLSAAVRKAAEAMRYTEERATVMLLSDGLENCEMDPCALARDLEAAGVDFTVHVIGFDVSETDAAELSCLAEETGGKFFLAGDAGELTQSLRQTVQTIVAEPEPKVVVAEPRPEPEPQGPIGLRAQVRLCETCEVLTDDVFWWLQKPDVDIKGDREEVSRNGSAEAIFEVAPGAYYLTVRVGETYGGQAVTVEDGALTDVLVTIGAGNLRVNAVASEGGTALDDDMFYWVYEPKADLSGNRKEVARAGQEEAIFTLPAGDYVLQARHGDTHRTVDVRITSGELTDIVLPMDVAYLRLDANPAPGAATLTDDMFYWVYEAKTDLSGNRKEVSRSGSAEPLFKLPAGDYVVQARHGSAFSSIDVSLGADSLTSETIDMNVGYARLHSAMAAGQPALTNDLFYWVNEAKTDLSGNRKEVARNGSAEALFKLPAGAYQAVVRHGSAIRTFDLEVEAGQLTEQTLILDTGILTAQAALTTGGAPLTSGVFWYLLHAEKDLSGNQAEQARAGAATARFIAPAGDYVLRARFQDEFFDFPISIEAGKAMDMTAVVAH